MLIVDLTNVIAGPTIAATLSRFGAKVTKVDPTTPAFDPWSAVICGLQGNRGKQSVLMDIAGADGRAVLRRLLAGADVVTVNATERQVDALGLDREGLGDMNPNLVLCHIDAWGGPRRGPRSDAPGYDDTVQAATGIMARFGGGLDTPEEHAHFGTIDVLGGLCAAFGAVVALYKRARGGGADVARTSLAAAGQLIQLPYMHDYEGRPPFDEPSGRAVLGERPSYRCYQAADGWFFLACPADRLRRLAVELGLERPARSDDDPGIAASLADAFSARPVEEWIAMCRRLDIGAHRLETMSAVREANLADESATPAALGGRTLRFTRDRHHPSGRVVDLVAPAAVRPRRAAISSPPPAPKYGADGDAILADAGYSPEEIDALVRAGVVGRQWSDDYLPD